MKDVMTNLLNKSGLAWWVEIVTQTPRCTYYFGPFLNKKEAVAAKEGYVEDLEGEGAVGIAVTVKRCQPGTLTIFEDLGGELTTMARTPVLSGQM